MSPLRLGIFGGTFDPIHNGHIRAAEIAIDALELDKLLLVPTKSSIGKSHQASAEQRAKMVQLAIKGQSKIELSRVDIDRIGQTFTFDTLSDLAKANPGAKLFFILGIDAFSTIDTWKNFQNLSTMATFVVLSRPGYRHTQIDATFPHRQLSIDALDLSSSEIRELIRAGRDVSGKVPASVLKYAVENRLYLEAN